MFKTLLAFLVSFVFIEVSESCYTSLCQKYCPSGYIKFDNYDSAGCNCACCPRLRCRKCFMRRIVIAYDEYGCRTCRCSGPL